jgi:hypothetical protein
MKILPVVVGGFGLVIVTAIVYAVAGPSISPFENTPNSSESTYIDPRTIEFDRFLADSGGPSLGESRQRLIDTRVELYNQSPELYSEFASAAEYAEALGYAYDQALLTTPTSGRAGSGAEEDQLKARVDEIGTHVFDGPDLYEESDTQSESR